MTDLVNILIADDRWSGVDLGTLAQKSCAASLAMLNFDPTKFEIAVLGCDDDRISGLNADFRDKPTPTNVLSWPEFDLAAQTEGEMPNVPEPGELGNIAIAFDTCQAEARAQDKFFRDHICHLLTHATLHLLGFDHIRQKDAALMEGLEVKILAKLGIADPY